MLIMPANSDATDAQCTSCLHAQVCKLRDILIKAQRSANLFRVETEDCLPAKPIADLNFIKPVQLECIHYYQDATVTRNRYFGGAVDCAAVSVSEEKLCSS